MASYSGMSEYDIRVREDYKKQQAAAITASRDYKKNNYLSAMGQQTATQPAVTTTPKTNTNTQTLGGSSSTGGSSSSGYTGGGYIAGSGTTGSSGSSSGGRTGPYSSGYTPSTGTSKRTTGSSGSSSGSTTNSNEPAYTWVHQDKMSSEDNQMRQEYYEKKDQLPFVLPGVSPKVYLDALEASGGQVPIASPYRGLGDTSYSTPQSGVPFAPTASQAEKDYFRDNPGSFSYATHQASSGYKFAPSYDPRSAWATLYPQIVEQQLEESKRKSETLEQNQQDLIKQNLGPLDYANTFHTTAGLQHAADILRQSTDYQVQIDESKEVTKALQEELYRAEYLRWSSLSQSSDFNYYAAKGASRQNPSRNDVERLWGSKQKREGQIGNIVTYSQENLDAIRNDEADRLSPAGSSLYGHLTAEEVQIYNYLLGKNGKQAAQEYLDFMQETLNAREGVQIAEAYANIESPFWRTVAALPYGLGAGVDRYVSGVKQLFSEDALPISPTQFASQGIQQNLGPVGGTLYGTAASVGNILPSILLSKGIGAIGAAANIGATAVGVASQIAGSSSMGASIAGNAYSQAKHEGYSTEQAKTYAALVGASETALQSLMGGISALGGISDDVLLAKLKDIDNIYAQMAAAGVIKIGSEVAEEELQLLLDPLFRSLVFDEEYQTPTRKEMLETAIVAALSTGVLEGPSIVDYSKYGDLVLNTRPARNIINDALQGSDPNSITGRLAHDLAEQVSAGKTPSSADLGKLFAMTQANTQLGEGVKAKGTATTLLADALALPTESQAHQLAQSLSERLETSLTELGLDASELYHMSRGQQLELIDQVTDKVLSNQDLGELARLMREFGSASTQNTTSTTEAENDMLDVSNSQKDSVKASSTPEKASGFIMDPRQFGHKVKRHAKDYNLDPSSEEDRAKFLGIITDIYENATGKRIGVWRGQEGNVVFHIKGDDVVVTKQDGSFITILKGGINNERVKNARKQ